MKYAVHFSALFLISATAMSTQSSPKTIAISAHRVSRVALTAEPVPSCSKYNPQCGIDN
jgi:hypothetical protein